MYKEFNTVKPQVHFQFDYQKTLVTVNVISAPSRAVPFHDLWLAAPQAG